MSAEGTAYRERNQAAQLAARMAMELGWQVGWLIDPDEPHYPVLYIETPRGQVSWHIPKAERVYEPVDRTESFGPMVWDGHTDEQKAERLRALVAVGADGLPF